MIILPSSSLSVYSYYFEDKGLHSSRKPGLYPSLLRFDLPYGRLRIVLVSKGAFYTLGFFRRQEHQSSNTVVMRLYGPEMKRESFPLILKGRDQISFRQSSFVKTSFTLNLLLSLISI